MKNLTKQLAVLLVAVMLSSGLAWAQDAEVDGRLSVARCVQKGDQDYGLFLSSVIASDGFVEGVLEPWNDVIFRNECHSRDVLGLIRQRDQLRQRIRDAHLTCNTERVPRLQNGFYRANAEIYYVRHIVDEMLVSALPAEILKEKLEKSPSEIFTDESQLYAEMYERYVGEDKIPEDQFSRFFGELQDKYEDRKASYVICGESGWSEVAKKWQEFVDTGGGIGSGLEKLEKNTGRSLEKLEESAEDLSFRDYVTGIVQLNVNGLPAEEGFDEILSKASGSLPDIEGALGQQAPGDRGGSQGVSQLELLNAVEAADEKVDFDKIRNEIATEFEILYKGANDTAVENFVNEIDKLDRVIKASFAPMSQILNTCVEIPNSRQCKASI